MPEISLLEIFLIGSGLFLIALLYSSVGHAGASGYIAVMTLANLNLAEIRSSVLLLNILVASLATWQFAGQGYLRWQLLWPFALLAVPMAFLGGYWAIPNQYLKWLLGLILLFSACRLLPYRRQAEQPTGPPGLGMALLVGAVLGLLAGLSGTGGGIFLTPLLLLAGWASPKQAAAVSALFILLNSVAGLSGNLLQTGNFPFSAMVWFPFVIFGGLAGSFLGSRKFGASTIKRLLAIVLIIAGGKLLLT
jgi:uncharacterized membrane protein YfcA